MPIVDDGSGIIQQALMLLEMGQRRKQQQGQNQIGTALPGQTVGDVGMSPDQFAALFGKDTPYDPKRVLKDEHASDILDTNLKGFLRSADPVTLANISASMMNRNLGGTGFTTTKGLSASMESGGRAAETANVVSKDTQQQAITTGKNKADIEAITSGSQKATALSVADMIRQGIDAMSKAPDDVKAAVGQEAAFGKTAQAVQQEQLKGQLSISSLRAAVDAQTNPNSPIHAFLAKNGLNLPTVLAGSAMGLNNLFDNYSKLVMQTNVLNKDLQLSILKNRLETAKDLSEKVFKGKLSPNQVLAVINAKESGKPIPKALEPVAAIYDHATEAAFQAAINEDIRKGDPVITSIQQQIQALQKPGVDPYALEAVRNMSAQAAAIAMTKTQVGDPPSDPAGRAKWDEVYKLNLSRVPKTSVKFSFWSPHSNVPMEGNPTAGPAARVQTQTQTSPTAIDTNSLSDEQKTEITKYIQSIGAMPTP